MVIFINLTIKISLNNFNANLQKNQQNKKSGSISLRHAPELLNMRTEKSVFVLLHDEAGVVSAETKSV